MTLILGIDPGPTQTGYAWYSHEDHFVATAGVVSNEDMIHGLRESVSTEGSEEYDPRITAVIEHVQHYGHGMSAGADVFETCIWSGRFAEAIESRGGTVHWIRRPTIKTILCGMPNAKDSNVRQALIDRFPATGNGKTPQIGTKKQPGPLYKVKGHAWSALACVVAWQESNK